MAFLVPNLCANLRPPTGLSYFTASFSVFLCLITIPGNFLVCLAIIKDPFRNLKTPFHYFLLSLAGTDLLVGTLMDPLSVADHTSEGLQFKIVDVKILHTLYFTLNTASILTLAALTADRYVAVASPVKYKTMVTSKRAIVTSALIWMAALGFSFIYFKLGYILYSFIFVNTAVIGTFIVLVVAHTSILKLLRARSKCWRDRRVNENTESGKQENRTNIKNTKKLSKAAKALLIVLLAFFASFTPAFVTIYLLNFCSSCNCLMIQWLRDLQFLMVLCNSGMNPFLYAWRIPQFKRAFMKFLHLERARGKVTDLPSSKKRGVDKPRSRDQNAEICVGEHEKISCV